MIDSNSSWVQRFKGSEFRIQRSTQNAEPKTGNAYQDVYDHAGRTRATMRGLIK